MFPSGLVQEAADEYVYPLSRGQQVELHNVGTRPAFVHLCSASAKDTSFKSSHVEKIIPSKFVLKAKDFQVTCLSLSYCLIERGAVRYLGMFVKYIVYDNF